MLKLGGFAILLSLISCTVKDERISDKTLTGKMDLKEVIINPKNSNRIVLNVEKIEPFDYCHISSNGSLYTINRRKSDSLLIISDSETAQMDTLSNTLEPFVSGYSFNMIIGNKLKRDTSDLSMDVQAMYSILIE